MPRLGDTVIMVGVKESNGSTDQPAIVTAVWGANCVNVMVLPDCGVPYSLTSVSRLDPRISGGSYFMSRDDYEARRLETMRRELYIAQDEAKELRVRSAQAVRALTPVPKVF